MTEHYETNKENWMQGLSDCEVENARLSARLQQANAVVEAAEKVDWVQVIECLQRDGNVDEIIDRLRNLGIALAAYRKEKQ